MDVDKHCKYFVKRKKRFCRMTVKSDKEYCGEHEPCEYTPETQATESKLRIVCPLDSKHTCYSHKLKKHLKICNARPKEAVPHIVKDINYGEVSNEVNTRLLSNVPVEVLQTVIKKVNLLYEELVTCEIDENCMQHNLLQEELSKSEYGERTKKHLFQASAILGILEANSLILDDTCYIEFGAGKGQLSYWISKCIEKQRNSSVLLIERAAHRHKLDNKLDKSDGQVHRVRADIGDLVLGELNVIKNSNAVVGVTKHLCGSATDLALKCLMKYNETGKNVKGIAMAFCCHHRCFWSIYTGKDFFMENKLTRDDFDAMCGMVSWATCGSGLGRDKQLNECHVNTFKQNERDTQIGLSRNEKEIIGIKCKYILNYGRLKYLEKYGFKCKLFHYVNSTITPENLCIVALKNT